MFRKSLFFLAICLVPSFAAAQPSIVFNGVDVTGTTNQRFTNVTVEFDGNGNVILTAPQYRLVDTTPQSTVKPSSTRPAEVAPTAATAPVAAPAAVPAVPALPNDPSPTYLFASFDSPGLLGFNIDVYVNGRYVKTVNQGQAQSVVDISSFLVKGTNSIQYRLVMAADSGTSHKATVELSLAKQSGKQAGAVELSGRYAPLIIKGADGAQSYTVDFIVP